MPSRAPAHKLPARTLEPFWGCRMDASGLSGFFSEFPFAIAILATFFATSVGGLPALALPRIADRTRGLIIWASIGTMSAALLFSLFTPAVSEFKALGNAPVSALAGTLFAACVGWLILARCERALEKRMHASMRGLDSAQAAWRSRAFILLLALCLHNVPEGFAVGSALAGPKWEVAVQVAQGIALQNLPEGTLAALALLAAGFGKRKALAATLFSALVEAVGAMAGFFAQVLVSFVLPWGLGFAAGAMAFAVKEAINAEAEIARVGWFQRATVAAGFALYFVLFL